MKKIIILLVLMFLVDLLYSQKLIDIYKTGNVYLVPDSEYAKDVDWNLLFDKEIGDGTNWAKRLSSKRIIVSDDGTVFMDHKNRYEIWKFNSKGNLVKKIGKRGSKPEQFRMTPSIQTIVDNKYFITSDVNSNIKKFDVDGNYIRSYSLKYMGGDFHYIGDNKIILKGDVLWPKKWRRVITQLNLTTGESEIIHSYFDNRLHENLVTLSNGKSSIVFNGIADRKEKIYLPSKQYFFKKDISFLSHGGFIIAQGATGEFKMFDKKGVCENSIKLEQKPLIVTQKDADEYYKKTKEAYKTDRYSNMPKWLSEELKKHKKKNSKNIEYYKDLSRYHPQLPYFSKVIVDSDDNLLVFKFTPKGDNIRNAFDVIAYENNGELIAKSKFICDGYKISFKPNSFQFKNGYLYSMCEKNDVTGVTLRLMRFKLSTTPNPSLN